MRSKDLTTFASPWGRYKFRRMPFGLKNAPAVFQRMVDGVLAKVRECCGCYIYDVLIYSSNWEEHMRDLKRVLRCLDEAGLKIKLRKCSFGRRKLRYLGHIIGSGCVTVPEDRVSVLAEWPVPGTKRQLKRFLGTVGFYRRFVPDFAGSAAVLTSLTGKGSPDRLVWTDDCQSAFDCLRVSLCGSVCLCVPSPQDSFVLYTDASDRAVGACLHVIREDIELPVAFY